MFYALLAVSLMALDHRGHYVDRLRGIALQIAEPVFRLTDLPFAISEDIGDYLQQHQALIEQRDALAAELLETSARMTRLAAVERENNRLRQLLESAPHTETGYLAAELSAVDLDPFSHRIVVRRGRSDGVVAGMPVVDNHGVIGQVDQVMGSTSTVVLITDPDHALPVQIQPSGERTIAYGSGAFDSLRLNDLPMNTRTRRDSLILTSGLGGRFPAGLPVARVTTVQRQPGDAFAQAQARPLAAMDRNSFVLLLKPEPMTEEFDKPVIDQSADVSPEADVQQHGNSAAITETEGGGE